jgi:hypothetical protein
MLSVLVGVLGIILNNVSRFSIVVEIQSGDSGVVRPKTLALKVGDSGERIQSLIFEQACSVSCSQYRGLECFWVGWRLWYGIFF